MQRGARYTAPSLDKSLAIVPFQILSILLQCSKFHEPIYKSQNAPTTQEVTAPHAIIGYCQITRNPVHVVIIDVEALLGIDTITSAECGVENFPRWLRRLC